MGKVAIIGAGIGGLAAALRIREKGHDVTVFEQAGHPGGKLMEFEKDGFRFDMGPSLFTMPEFVTELFGLFGKNHTDYFDFERLDNTCNYFFPDGSLIRAWSDHQKFLDEIGKEDHQAVVTYLDKAKELYESTANLFLFNPFPSKSSFLSAEGRRIGKNPGMLDAFTSLHKRNRKSFRDQRLVQIFDRYATYNGSNPYKTPATLKLIAHLEHNTGAFFPKGGMYDIVRSLFRLATEEQVKFRFNTRVDRIQLSDNGLKTVEWGGERDHFDWLISDVDVYTFYSKLLSGAKVPWSVTLQQRSSSALIFYWGMKENYPELDIHNILFSGDYQDEFKHLFKWKTISPDPTVYIFISSRKVLSDAPDGMENWFVMINAPENIGQNWDELVTTARENILKKISGHLNKDVREAILFEKMIDPREIESRTGSYAGSLYGTSSNSRFSAFLRHPNRKNKLPGVYFVGGSVHPGGGIPLCLASAKIVVNQIPKINDQA